MSVSNKSIEYFFAEVIGFDQNYTFKYPDGNGKQLLKTPYDIEFKTYGTQRFKDFASPANNSIKQIPLIGEHVIIFKTITKETTDNKYRFKWNYLPALPVQDIGVNNNKLYIQSNTDNDSEKTIKLLQPYAGDLLIEGRFGNRIRLGRTIESVPNNAKPTIWKPGTGKENDPIIILSVDKEPGSNELYVEQIKSMASSLHLTSTQDLSDSYQLSKELSKSNGSRGSEFIGSADRMILQSKSGPVVIDSKSRVSINANEVLIGSEQASSPIPKGDVLEQILNLIISAIQSGVIGPAGIYSTPTPGQGSLSSAQSLLAQLNSTKFYIDKE